MTRFEQKINEYVQDVKEEYESQRNELAEYLGKEYGLDSSEIKSYTLALEKYRATLNLGLASFDTVKQNLEYKILSAAKGAVDCGYMNSTCAMTRAMAAIKLSAMADVLEYLKHLERYRDLKE